MSSADLSDLVRVRGNTIAALVDDGAFFGEVYPAISYDDGGDWRIDGPRFALAAADSRTVTNHLAVSRDGTVIAWSRSWATLETQPRSAGRWYAADFGGGVRRADVHGSRLVVQAIGNDGTTYSSHDDGRTWQVTATTP